VLIDGSEFTGKAELDEVYGAKIIMLDDINGYKNYHNYQRLVADKTYELIAENWQVRNGYAAFRRIADPLPIHFFTIVLNGEPFIRYHIEVLKQLPFKWHWHIVEGVADLKHDTAWSLQFGGRITDELHRDGLSNDGTTEYLDGLKREFPENITIYRKPAGVFWDGKLEMVNAPVDKIDEECLLWQIDVDELWTRDQLIAARQMFGENPTKSAAYYYCYYFVGEHLVTTTRDTYGNNTSYEWLRTWRFKPGMRWMAHEPPRLCIRLPNGKWEDVAKVAPIKHSETKAGKLVFQHYAYATEKQLRFKELYFGYREAVKQWELLQKNRQFPIFLRDFFSWVNDDARVDTIKSLGLTPIAQKNDKGKWFFMGTEQEARGFDPYDVEASTSSSMKNILWVRTDSIGDNILAASMLPYIRGKYKDAKITAVCQKHIAEIYEACPFVDDIITFERQRAYKDEEYRSSIIQQLQAINADITLNSVYSREPLTDVFTIGSGAKDRIAFNGNLCNISAEIRDKHNQFYTRLMPSIGEHKPELERHRDFLKGLGIDVVSLQPIIWATSEDEQFAQKLFNNNNINPENTIALFPGAQHHHKVYQHYQSVLQHFQDFDLVVLGGKDAMVQADKICEKFHGNCVNLAGKTSICQMASVIRRCRLFLGSDSAGAHVACAVGVPNVVIQGGGHFSRFLPYSPLTSVVCVPLECYSCNWQCPYQKVHCISDILPDVIIEAIRQTLKQSSKTPRVFVQTNSLWNPQEGQPKWKALDQYLGLDNVEIISVGAEPYSIEVSDLNLQGENLFAKGDLEGALDAFKKALDIDPGSAITHNNLGALYYNRGEKEKALNHYQQAAQLQPENIT
ncbi:MAG: tetratricopeptide repeat protein, partial [Deltaproteobacteria bacterium]|nr:tetratricopeptide repeat protein [Deltaproteobacteria bacterium]